MRQSHRAIPMIPASPLVNMPWQYVPHRRRFCARIAKVEPTYLVGYIGANALSGAAVSAERHQPTESENFDESIDLPSARHADTGCLK
jgi:hypothetical protein